MPWLLVVLLEVTPVAARLAIPPAPAHRVNDHAGALPAGDRERLERRLAERERTSSNQVVVAIFRWPGDGLVEAVRAVGETLRRHFPRAPDERNELSDRVSVE